MLARTITFGRTQTFIGFATHFGWCVNWQSEKGRWEKLDRHHNLTRWVPDSRQIDVYVPFVFFGIKWEGQGGLL